MKVFHSAALVSRPAKPIKWLIEGLLPLGTLGDISGSPGDGKSTLALSLADHISRGQRWFGRAVQQMPVVWISGEASDEDAVQRDLQRLNAGRDSDITFILPDEEMFRWDQYKSAWVTTSEGSAVLKHCQEIGAGFIITDTGGSLCAGLKEIDNDQQRQFARYMRRELLLAAHIEIELVRRQQTGLNISHTNQMSQKDDLEWRLHYLSRAGGNGFPGAIRWAAGVSLLRPDDAKRLGGRVTEDEIVEARMFAFGISKHNEMPRPSWNNRSPAIFDIKQSGELVMIADGEAIAMYQRSEAAAKPAPASTDADKYGLRPMRRA